MDVEEFLTLFFFFSGMLQSDEGLLLTPAEKKRLKQLSDFQVLLFSCSCGEIPAKCFSLNTLAAATAAK